MGTQGTVVGDDWLRQWTPPEEDRHLYTSRPWREGEARWFRSPNVIDLMAWRRRKRLIVDPQPT